MISVIVPIYHGKKYVSNIVDMIEKNAVKISEKVELLFVVDNPDEKIDELCESAKISVKTIYNKQNRGIHYSRVQGIYSASGTYILMLDQDDEISDNFLANQLSALGKADMVVANGYEELEKGRKILYKYYLMQWTVKYNIFYTLFGSRIISPGQCLIRKKSIPRAWCENIVSKNGADDYLLWLLMFGKGLRIKINRDRLYIHKFTGSNTSGNQEQMNTSVREVLEIARKEHVISKFTHHFVLDRVNGKKGLLQKGLGWIVRVGNGINRS